MNGSARRKPWSSITCGEGWAGVEAHEMDPQVGQHEQETRPANGSCAAPDVKATGAMYNGFDPGLTQAEFDRRRNSPRVIPRRGRPADP
jgi:hypothetical protein